MTEDDGRFKPSDGADFDRAVSTKGPLDEAKIVDSDKVNRYNLEGRAYIDLGEGTWVRYADYSRLRRQLSLLIMTLSSVFEWKDQSYMHAMSHIENAVNNLRADVSTERITREQIEKAVILAKDRLVKAEEWLRNGTVRKDSIIGDAAEAYSILVKALSGEEYKK